MSVVIISVFSIWREACAIQTETRIFPYSHKVMDTCGLKRFPCLDYIAWNGRMINVLDGSSKK
jgi:hypothetical protein